MRRFLTAVLALFGVLGRCWPIPPPPRRSSSKSIPAAAIRSPGRINDAVAVTFILDTGASDVLIPDEVARELERAGKLDRGDFIGTRTYVLADGSKVPSRRVLLRELTVGGADRVECHGEHRPVRQPAAAGAEFSVQIRLLDARQRAQRPRAEGQGRRSARRPPPRAAARQARAGPYGAFAHDDTSGRYGASWNQVSQARADEAALKGCASESCKIVFRIAARQCGAIAMTENGKIWGGATRSDRNAAERAAVENCEKRTSASCRLRSVQCNR